MKLFKSIFSIGCAVALAGVLAGCSSTKSTFDPRAKSAGVGTVDGEVVKNELNPAWLQGSQEFFTLGPGDVFEAGIVGSPDTRTTLVVGPDGKVYFYLLPGTDVWGLTLSGARELLQKELSKYVTGAQVSVSLASVGSKSIWMLGRVNRPGIYPMSGPMTLLEAIAQAGGPSQIGLGGTVADQADLSHSFVQRRGQLVPVDFQKLLVDGDMSQNIYLQPDDFIYLPSSLFHEVFVLGAVGGPRSVPYSDHLTLVKAVSSAGGLIPGAYGSHVAIVRGSLAEPKVAIVDYKEIIKGKATDIKLEPHDIVYVPFQPMLGLQRYARSILNTFVTTVAANEGVNAVTDNGTTVGITVAPVGTSQQSTGGSSSSGGTSSGGSTP
jgi:polysaccharide biosynthesis/export protein